MDFAIDKPCELRFTRRCPDVVDIPPCLEKCLPQHARSTKNQSLAKHPVKGDGLWFVLNSGEKMRARQAIRTSTLTGTL